jgi:hypothetical protein
MKNPDASADIFSTGREALAAARAAFEGRGFYVSAHVLPVGFVRVPYTFGEPEEDRRARLAGLAASLGDGKRETHSIVPTPVGEAQGLDTVGFFAACRMALPSAHIVVDLELLGHKLGQLCLSFGADELMGSIVNQRALRLGERASSNELTREEAAQLLRASGFAPCERLAEGKAPAL